MTLHSDIFTAIGELDPIWRIDDPLGDGDVSVDGANVLISIPSGDHSHWKPLKALSLLQPAPSGDFGIEVKFDSLPTADYQGQGIVVRESATRFVMIETYHLSGVFKAITARVLDGGDTQYINAEIPPAQYLRLERAGNDWTFSHSADGGTWVQGAVFQPNIAPTEIGVFASNTGSAFVAELDYFVDLEDPLVDTDSPP